MLEKDFNIIVDKKGKFLVTNGGTNYYGYFLNLFHESLTKDEVNKFILTVKVAKYPYIKEKGQGINSPEDRLRICKKLLESNVPFVKEIMKEYIQFCNDKIQELMDRNKNFETDSPVRIWNEELIKDYVRIKDNWNHTLKAYKTKNNFIKDTITDLDVSRAKDYPIRDIIKFNSGNFACCIFHSEDTPSMKYYPNSNTVHCFGCNVSADAIAVAQQIYGENFINSVKRLSGK